MRRFAKTIVKVLIAYADIVKMEFPEHMRDERIVSTIAIKPIDQAIGKLFNKYIWINVNWDFLTDFESSFIIGLHSNEQHTTVKGPIGEDVRVDGWR